MVIASYNPSTLALAAGARLGSYEIVSALGAGGMGEVYRATDTALKRQVALKVLPVEVAADPERVARFQREAELLAALNHQNIAHLYGLENSNGSIALVMELVEGPTLADRVAEGPIPLAEALTIARQITEALEAAHEHGIVHRDLKPANIKVRTDGTVKVLDFGLAKALAGAGHSVGAGRVELSNSPTVTSPDGMTGFGVVLGTAAYMAPEQARGRVVDRRADIWAFGCVLYEMLTGRTAFARETVSDTIAAVLEREPDFKALASAPSGLVRLLRRLLEKDARRRLRDIGDARLEIDDLIAGIGSPAHEPSSQVSQRWRAFALTASAGFIVATLALVAIIVRLPRASPLLPVTDASRAVASQLTNYGGTEQAPALSPDGRSFVFVSDHGGTPDIWLRQVSGGEPVRLSNDTAVESDLAYAPDGETLYFSRRDGSTTSIWATGVLGGQPRKIIANGHTPSPSPDGKSIAYLERETGQFDTLVVGGLSGEEKRTLAQHISTFPPLRASWSRDGRRLSFVRAGLFAIPNLFIVDAAGGDERQVTHISDGSGGTIGQHAWLPDNRHLVVSYSPYSRTQSAFDLGILDVESGSISRLTATILDSFSAPSVSADGSRMIATMSHPMREIWKVPLTSSSPDVNGRSAAHLLQGTADPLWTFVGRDGGTLLFNSPASGSRNLWTFALDGQSTPRQITAVGGDAISHSSLSPDGSRVVFASLASGHSDLWTQNVDGSELRQLTNDPAADNWPVWSPDGRSIVFASLRDGGFETRVISADGGASEKIIDGFFRGDWIGTPTGKGSWITSSDGVDTIRLIDAERRTVLWEKRIAGSGRAMPVFAPDGRAISIAIQEGAGHDVLELLDVSTGEGHVVARLPFPTTFRASWTDRGNALIVNRAETVSNIALFDHFWEQGRR